VGKGALVAAGSVVAAGASIPAGMLASGAPAVVRRPVRGSGAETWVELNPGAYGELAQRHRRGIAFVERDEE
jgi:carbonic anhydrase/acetyltransferase-like protein (isoleucine patch superfamily)